MTREIIVSAYLYDGVLITIPDEEYYFHKWGKAIYKDVVVSVGIIEQKSTVSVQLALPDFIRFAPHTLVL